MSTPEISLQQRLSAAVLPCTDTTADGLQIVSSVAGSVVKSVSSSSSEKLSIAAAEAQFVTSGNWSAAFAGILFAVGMDVADAHIVK